METSIKDGDFIVDCVNLLQYKCHRKNVKRCGSYTDSPDWIKNKKATINHIIKRILHAFNTLQQSHKRQKIGKNPKRITKLKPFIDKYNREGITHQKKMTGKKLKKII